MVLGLVPEGGGGGEVEGGGEEGEEGPGVAAARVQLIHAEGDGGIDVEVGVASRLILLLACRPTLSRWDCLRRGRRASHADLRSEDRSHDRRTSRWSRRMRRW